MFYSFEISTPKSISESNKQKTVLRLCKGVTYRVEFLFPPGPYGLLHVQVCDALYQVWPTNTDGDLRTDDETISFNDAFPIDQPPYELYAYTWNEDEDNAHVVIIRIGINPLSESVYLSAEELSETAMG